MPIQIGQKPESDFTNPLGLLSDCHRRIERFLAVLVKLSDLRNGGALLPDERSALQTALTYFHNSAPKHTADEEDSLFPRLRAASREPAALEALAALEGDHETAARDHALVETLGSRWLADGVLSPGDTREMKAALDALSRLYARHIALEDQELFPLAARLLPAGQLAEVGREMARRRHIEPPVQQ